MILVTRQTIALALALSAALAGPAAAAPFATGGGVAAEPGVVEIGHRHHHHYYHGRGDAAAAAAAVGVGAFALGLLAGSAAQPPAVVVTPEPIYRPAPRVIYREAPPVYECHIERTRQWDPYIGATVIRDRRICY
jgi:hypothetical protein